MLKKLDISRIKRDYRDKSTNPKLLLEVWDYAGGSELVKAYGKRYKLLRIPARVAGGNTGKSYVQAQKFTPLTVNNCSNY